MPSEGWITQVRKGLLELCILNLLRDEPVYGYEIVKRLTGAPELVISEGTIYPILSRLKREKLVTTTLRESDKGPVRKYYSLTAAGRKRVDEMNVRWSLLKRAISKIVAEK
jgi:PadR family transcriptional regulator PadR